MAETTTTTPGAPAAPGAADTNTDPKAGPPPGATAAEKKIWRLKADGEEFDFDASDEEAIKREIMKARGANKRFESAAAMRRQAEEILARLKNDPKSILTHPSLGLDFKKIAEEFLWEQMQEERLTPEQKKQRAMEAELKKYKEDEEKKKKDADDQAFQAEVSKYQEEFGQKVMAALESNKVPKTTKTVKRMGEYMQLAIANGLEITPADLVHHVRQEIEDEERSSWDELDDDRLIELLGEKRLERIRSADLKRLKSTQGSVFQTPAPKPTERRGGASDARPKRLSGSDWRAEIMRETGFAKKRK